MVFTLHLLTILISAFIISVFTQDEPGAFEFPKQRPAAAKYFDDYGHINTHFAQRPPSAGFKRPNTAVLSNLFKSYSLTMRDLGISTWLAQGTLLSWCWNHHVFPWETDIDMQMSLLELEFLAESYNMTVYQFRFPDTPGDEINEYLLDISPHHAERLVGRDDNNKIDARWVDMSNGAYIDITAIHALDPHARENGRPVYWQTKDGHVYENDHVYPLQATVFEGVETLVPNEPETLSAKEYSESSLTDDIYHGYKFDEHERQWIAIRPDETG